MMTDYYSSRIWLHGTYTRLPSRRASNFTNAVAYH